MKSLKKMMALALAMVMVLAMGITVFAQTEGTAADGKGSITINNAAKGETYSVVKIFGATLTNAPATGDSDGIAYTGDIPTALADYFEKDSTGNVRRKASATDDAALVAAVQAYAKTQSATASATSDGSALTFQGLDYGYYAVISTQGATVTIDSLRPNATVNDKNTKDITAEKTVEETSYTIGETINYTATFDTVNFYGSGDAAKQVLEYTITDTLPAFLSNVAIDSIVVTKKDGTTEDAKFTDKSFNANGEVVIPWADEVAGTSNPKKWTSKYDNGAKIIVTYHGTLTSTTNINIADKNTVKIQPTVVKDDGTPDDKKPWDENWQDSAEIKTYGTALKKVDGQTKEALKGAKFQVPGLTVEAVANEPGVYKVVSYNATSTTAGTEMSTNDDGKLYILGLASDVTLSATETAAPEGYNKADAAISLPAQGTLTTEIYETSGTRYYDKDGNLVREEVTGGSKKEDLTANYATILDPVAVEVVNNKGTELPSTGGIGTTIFYVIGAILVLGAGILLVTRRRMNAN